MPIDVRSWEAMTPAVNEMKSPNTFLKKLMFGSHDAKSVETIEIGVYSRARKIAPFVRKNGAAIMVAGHDETQQSVEAPNIRIKRPFTPSELLFNRRPGTVVFPSTQEQVSALEQHIARDLKGMNDDIANAEEWLCALAIRGTISYSVNEQENFSITYPKPAAHNATLAAPKFWDDVDLDNPDPELDFHRAKRIVNGEVGLGLTDAIMGESAAENFLKIAKHQRLLDTRNVDAGRVTFNSQFDEDGVIYLGRFSGLDCWEYSRSADLNGVATPMIRSKYVEFVTRSPGAQNVLYYGAIPDMKALQGRLFQGERFAKSWEEEDPSAIMALVHARPLPCPRRPGSLYSLKVVSGA